MTDKIADLEQRVYGTEVLAPFSDPRGWEDSSVKLLIPDNVGFRVGDEATVVWGTAPNGLVPAGDGVHFYGTAVAALRAGMQVQRFEGEGWADPGDYDDWGAGAVVRARRAFREVQVPWEVALRDRMVVNRWTDEDGVTRVSRIRKAEVGVEPGDVYLTPEITRSDDGEPYRGVVFKPDPDGTVRVLVER